MPVDFRDIPAGYWLRSRNELFGLDDPHQIRWLQGPHLLFELGALRSICAFFILFQRVPHQEDQRVLREMHGGKEKQASQAHDKFISGV